MAVIPIAGNVLPVSYQRRKGSKPFAVGCILAERPGSNRQVLCADGYADAMMRGMDAIQHAHNPATRNRTRDHLIAAAIYSQMLYQLSYSRLGSFGKVGVIIAARNDSARSVEQW